MLQVSCPSCGNQVIYASPALVQAVCDACQSVVVRRDVNVDLVGKVGLVQEDGSPIQLGTCGTHKGRSFEVVGRIQVRYPEGLWNEWYIMYGPEQLGWLGEAQGNYFVNVQVQPTSPLPPFESMKVGTSLRPTLASGPVKDCPLLVVTSRYQVEVTGCQGTLPFAHAQGYRADVVDLKSTSAFTATIDYSESPPLLFVGETVSFDELHLTNLRQIEGW